MVLRLWYRTWMRPTLPRIMLIVFVLGLGFLIGRAVIKPSNIRTLLGLTFMFLTIAISIRKPNASIVMMVIYLPLLGLIRRILIPIAGWGSLDPLVLVAPVCGLLIGSYWFYRYLWLREPLLNDTPVFKLARLMVLIDLLEVLNPRQGSPFVGIGGIIFYVVPLFWMVTARTVVTEKTMRAVIHTTFVMGVVAAIYGLKQTYYGFYPFEEKWIHLLHFTALHVGNTYRALSTPDNPQEYAEFLAVALCVAWLYLLRGNLVGKLIGLLGASVIGWALFMESARGPLILGVVAISGISILSARTTLTRVLTIIAVGGAVAATMIHVSHMSVTSNALVEHQIAGITGQNSTLQGHISTMFSGIWRGAKSIIGFGLGSTTNAAGKFASTNGGTEVDFSNMFVSDGLIGGVVYLILMANLVVVAVKAAHRRSLIGLFTFGALLATFEQWINGELYVVATILWISIGYTDRLYGNERNALSVSKPVDREQVVE